MPPSPAHQHSPTTHGGTRTGDADDDAPDLLPAFRVARLLRRRREELQARLLRARSDTAHWERHKWRTGGRTVSAATCAAYESNAASGALMAPNMPCRQCSGQ